MMDLLRIVFFLLCVWGLGDARSTVTTTVVKRTTRPSYKATVTKTSTTTRTYFQKPYGTTTVVRTTTSTVTNTTYTTVATLAGFVPILDSLPGASSAPDYFSPSSSLSVLPRRTVSVAAADPVTVTVTRTSTIYTPPPSGTKTLQRLVTATTKIRPTRTFTRVFTHKPAVTLTDPAYTSYDACAPTNFANRVATGGQVYPLDSLEIVNNRRFDLDESFFGSSMESCCNGCYSTGRCVAGYWDSTGYCRLILANTTGGATCDAAGQYRGGRENNNSFQVGLGSRDRARDYELILFNGACGRIVGNTQPNT